MPLFNIKNKTKSKLAFTNPIGSVVFVAPGQTIESVELAQEFVDAVSRATDLKFSVVGGESKADPESGAKLDAANALIADNDKTIAALREQVEGLKAALAETSEALKESEKVVAELQKSSSADKGKK